MGDGRTPDELREGVRSGILASIRRDVDLRSARTARRLAGAGLLGVLGAVAATALISGHPVGPHAPWHLAVFACVWAGLLVVSLSIVFLQLRTPALPLARAACVGILGLGLAGICGAVCPDRHFLHWWSATPVGREIASTGGPALSALCFGGVSSLFFGAVAAFAALRGRGRPPVRPLLPAAMLLLLLSPGVALQSMDTSWSVFLGWLIGTGAGSYAGVAGGIRVRWTLSAS
jgi:hypothetical protein